MDFPCADVFSHRDTAVVPRPDEQIGRTAMTNGAAPPPMKGGR